MDLKARLDEEYNKRNEYSEVSEEKPDPIIVARQHKDDYSILICALFSYGNAKQIVKFLNTLPFDLLNRPVSENTVRQRLENIKYRFQTNEDITQLFIALQKIKAIESKNKTERSLLYLTFMNSYLKNNDVVEGINSAIELIENTLAGYKSQGLEFLLSKTNGKSPLKRWNMFLRWMVRNDNIDLGLWQDISTSDLIVPLDTHTFKIGKQLGLITQKTYNINAAKELTKELKKLDPNDPVKYDFALYRIGQEKISFKV